MTKDIDVLANKLGATVVGEIPDYSAGAFGVASLAKTLRNRLEPSRGRRPGRPSDPRWSRRPKVPMAVETEQRLRALADLLSNEERRISPMQVAAQLLEEATASFAGIRAEGNAAGRRTSRADRGHPRRKVEK